MRWLNPVKDSKRAELANDVQEWLAKGNDIPLVPIIARDFEAIDKIQRTHAKPGKRPIIATPEMIGQMLVLNKNGWTRDNIGRRLGVSRATVTRELIKAGAVKESPRW